jgi:hypothetical protein
MTMDAKASMEPAANPKSGDGYAYPVRLLNEELIHLTTGCGETLCNTKIDRTASTDDAVFGSGDCSTCRRMAAVRDLEIAGAVTRS